MYEDEPYCQLNPDQKCFIPVTNCGEHSYCKLDSHCPVCFGMDVPCTDDLTLNGDVDLPPMYLDPQNADPPSAIAPGGVTVNCGAGSYCMFDKSPSVCHGSNIPCTHPVTDCGAGSYCMSYKLGEVPVCHGSNVPCTEPVEDCGEGSWCKPMAHLPYGNCHGSDALCYLPDDE